MPILLLDISNSIIGKLNNLCNNFYSRLIDYLISKNISIYTFPALNFNDVFERIVFSSRNKHEINDIVDRICNPGSNRGTPLIRAINNVLSREQNIDELIILSDMLSDRSDDPNMIDDVVRYIKEKIIRLKLIYIQKEQSPIEKLGPAIRLFQGFLGKQVCNNFGNDLEKFRCLLGEMYNYRLIDYIIISDIVDVAENRLDHFLQELDHFIYTSPYFIEF